MYSHLGYTILFREGPTFSRNTTSPSGSKSKPSTKPRKQTLGSASLLFGLLCDPEDGSDVITKRQGFSNYTALHPRIPYSSESHKAEPRNKYILSHY